MNGDTQPIFPTVLVVLGATGDLARRKLIPALWELFRGQQLPELLQIMGFAKDELSDEEFQEWVGEILHKIQISKHETQTKHGAESTTIKEFCRRFTYEQGLFEDAKAYNRLGERMGRVDNEWRLCANKLFYIAASPAHYKTILQNLAASGLTEPCSPEEGWTRVILEKPFGKDLTTAQELDAMLGKLFREEQVYRVDHYLGKDTVRNLLAFRFSNSFLEPAWDARGIDHVNITLWETGGVEERGALYDGLGALKDVGQNHLLQLLALLAMDNPGVFEGEVVRRERARVLETLETMDEADIVRQTRRAQYDGYQAIEGVAPRSTTETYFWIQTYLKSARWAGVPFYLEAGKKMPQDKVEVAVHFRHQTPCLCPPGQHYTNVLTYRIQPQEGIRTSFWVKRPGAGMEIEEKDFSFDYKAAYGGEGFIEAYTKLLLDIFRGDQTLFVSTDEILAAWKFVDPIARAWEKNVVELQGYRSGTVPHYAPHGGATRGASTNKTLGFIGLGKMGFNMVQRLRDYEWSVVATDQAQSAKGKAQQMGVKVVNTASEVVKNLVAPRVVWIMVPHQVVDDVLQELKPHLEKGDVIIDGGNSNYKESVRRAKELEEQGIAFLDVGVSGGPEGARSGACLMIGGQRAVYKKHMGLFSDLSGAGGYEYVGKSGAGHFVKMVHNGIEYGMMQALAEGFAVMRQKEDFDLNLESIANVYNHGSVIESRLVGWLKRAYDQYGPDLVGVSGSVAHSGEGQWTVEAAKELGVPVPIIEGALKFRVASAKNPSYVGQVLSALRNQFGGHSIKKSQ